MHHLAALQGINKNCSCILCYKHEHLYEHFKRLNNYVNILKIKLFLLLIIVIFGKTERDVSSFFPVCRLIKSHLRDSNDKISIIEEYYYIGYRILIKSVCKFVIFTGYSLHYLENNSCEKMPCRIYRIWKGLSGKAQEFIK